MANTPYRPAQRKLVHELIDWRRVECRLRSYPAIGRIFSSEMLRNSSERPPYFCHYLAWRLGVYEAENVFQRLEELLCCANQLPNWKNESRSFLNTAEIADFWALVWQLQVAEHLCEVGRDVRWDKSGDNARSPDLSAVVRGKRWYVECYVYRKSFDLTLFLEELLMNVDPQLRLRYTQCLPLSLPKGRDRARFLDDNCLAVNYALSTDFQLALSVRGWDEIERPELGPNLDALAVGTVGIDEQLSAKKLSAVAVAESVDRKGLSALATIR